MTAARRGQKAALPAASTIAKLPQWGRPADPQPHATTIPASATQRALSGHLTRTLTPSARVTGHDAIQAHTDSSGTRSGLPAFSKLHHGRFCSLRFDQPQDDIAVILAGSAQRLELVNVGLLDTDDEAASRVSFVPFARLGLITA
jgi:hypothetical protein